MQIILKEETFKYSIMDLERKGISDFLFVQIGNKRGFILTKGSRKLSFVMNRYEFPALIQTNEKVPLYKQDMDLRMGKRPQSTNNTLRPYNVRILEKCQDRYCYFVWSVV